jgi:hypothetical protein
MDDMTWADKSADDISEAVRFGSYCEDVP